LTSKFPQNIQTKFFHLVIFIAPLKNLHINFDANFKKKILMQISKKICKNLHPNFYANFQMVTYGMSLITVTRKKRRKSCKKWNNARFKRKLQQDDNITKKEEITDRELYHNLYAKYE
jgi:hypothetical protein